MPPKGHRHVGGMFAGEQGLFAGSGCSCSSTHSGTRHLDGNNHHFLRRNEFEAFEGEFAALDGLTETEVSYVNCELLRNCVDRSAHFEAAYHRHELTTGAHTFCETNGSDGHSHNDGLLRRYFVEVNVEDVVLYGVELDFLEDSEVLFAVNVEVYSVDIGRVDKLVDLLFVYNEVKSFGSAVGVFLLTVDNAGYETLLTNFFGGLLAEVGTLGTADRNRFHESDCVTLN